MHDLVGWLLLIVATVSLILQFRQTTSPRRRHWRRETKVVWRIGRIERTRRDVTDADS
jgi:hypothetical protein